MRYYVFCILLLTISACTKMQESEIDEERAMQVHEKFRQNDLRFMAEKDFEAISYVFADSKPVVSLNSSNLSEGYRLLVSTAFGDYTLITVYAKGNKGVLDLRVLDPKTPYLDTLKTNKIIPLTKKQMDFLRATVNENPFWEWDVPEKRGVRDGYSFYIEIKQNGHFYKDLKSNPEEGRLYTIAQCMLKLSGL